MSFPINVNIPAANNDPADDQPEMLKNNANIAGYLSVDHVAPGTVGDGFHKKTTYFVENPPLVAPLDSVSVEYTDIGVADITHPQLYWQNSQGEFPLSAIRAFGIFVTDSVPGPRPLLNGINVASIVSSAGGTTYTITLLANSVNGSNSVPIVTYQQVSAQNLFVNYGMANNVLTIQFNAPPAPVRKVSFLVLQI